MGLPLRQLLSARLGWRGRCGPGQGEQAGFGLGEDVAVDQAFELGADALGVPWFGADAQDFADLPGAESVSGLFEGGEDLAVAGRQRFGRFDAVLGGQFQHGCAGDVQAFQGAFGGGELFGEECDLFTQLPGGLAYQLLPGFDLVQEVLHRRSCSVGVPGAGRPGRARSRWWCG